MRRGFVTGCLMIVLAGWSAPTRADFVISIGSTSIAQGSTGTIDVFLTSTALPASPDVLNNLGFTLQITGPNDFVTFDANQNFSYLNASNYVFSGNSSDWINGQSFPPPSGGSSSQTVYPNDSFVGSDSTFSGNPVSLDSSNTPVLLATLTLDAAVITNVNDAYTISFVRARRHRLRRREPSDLLRLLRFQQHRHGAIGGPLHEYLGHGHDQRGGCP